MAAASSAGGPGVRAARRSDLGALLEMMGADYRESGYPFDGERAAACFLQLLESPALGAVDLVEPPHGRLVRRALDQRGIVARFLGDGEHRRAKASSVGLLSVSVGSIISASARSAGSSWSAGGKP
jgi:hypothetical protein